MERRGRPRVAVASLDPILLAAVGLIAEHGTAAVSMRDIAQAAGVSVGRLQHHFENRRNLVHRAQGWYLQSVVAELSEISAGAGGPWERLMGMFLHAAVGGDRHRRVRIWVDLLAQSAHDPEVRTLVAEINERWCAVMEGIIGEGMAAGAFRPVLGARETAETLVLLVDGLDVAELTGPPAGPVAARRLAVTASLLLGVEAGLGTIAQVRRE